jgi:hypothetical protein
MKFILTFSLLVFSLSIALTAETYGIFKVPISLRGGGYAESPLKVAVGYKPFSSPVSGTVPAGLSNQEWTWLQAMVNGLRTGDSQLITSLADTDDAALVRVLVRRGPQVIPAGFDSKLLGRVELADNLYYYLLSSGSDRLPAFGLIARADSEGAFIGDLNTVQLVLMGLMDKVMRAHGAGSSTFPVQMSNTLPMNFKAVEHQGLTINLDISGMSKPEGIIFPSNTPFAAPAVQALNEVHQLASAGDVEAFKARVRDSDLSMINLLLQDGAEGPGGVLSQLYPKKKVISQAINSQSAVFISKYDDKDVEGRLVDILILEEGTWKLTNIGYQDPCVELISLLP